MKKILAIFLMAVMVALPVQAESAPTNDTMAGLVVEIGEESLLVEDAQGERTQVNVTEETVLDAQFDIGQGDYVYVEYRGKEACSIPMQVEALRITCYKIEGEIVEVYDEDEAMLMRVDEGEEYYVRLGQAAGDEPVAGERAVVYFDGIAMLSYPAQISAGYVRLAYALEGEISAVDAQAGTFTVGEGAQAVMVNLGALKAEDFAVGESVRVTYDGKMTRSLPAQIFAMQVERLS